MLITPLWFRRLAHDALHMIAPALCPGCNAALTPEEPGYCLSCRASLEPAPLPAEMYAELNHAFPGDELALDAIGALYAFEPGSPVQRLIHAVKYGACTGLGTALGNDLGRALGMFPEFDGYDVVVPVPLHRSRYRERGYNQAETIARGVANACGIDLAPQLLQRRRHTHSQTTLGSADRIANTHRAFVVSAADVAGASVLVCDDVCTTGATLNACADALLDAGARCVAAATVARDLLSSAATGAVGEKAQ